MAAGTLSEDLRRFILTSVPSVPFMEALVLFRESHATPMTIQSLAARLYVDLRRAAEIVEQLLAARIIEAAAEGAGYLYAPAQEIAPVVDELAGAYRSNLVEVTGLIHSGTGRMAQRFADAFKWRKD